MKFWKTTELKYIRDNLHLSDGELAKHIGCTKAALKATRKRHRILREGNGQFTPGHEPWNKGKHVDIGGKATQFKPGHKPHNTKMDGYISIRRDKSGRGYKYIRLAKGKWALYHRHLWEKHNGAIPGGHVLRFKDGDSLNCSLDNLELVPRSDHVRLNHNREKAAMSMHKDWELDKMRVMYGLPQLTKLRVHQIYL